MYSGTKNVVNIWVDYSGSTPFLIVETEDEKSYQVKPPNIYSSAMLKEFISNQLAKGIGDIVPEGVFLSFTTVEKQLIPMLNTIKEYSGKLLEEQYDFIIENLKNDDDEIILFGVEWLGEFTIKIEDDEDLFYMLDNCSSDNFYSLFPLDLVLVNRDRHTGNILFFTNEIGMIDIYLIDHDRIFSSKEGIEQFYIIKEDFDCLKHYEHDQYKLFNYIDEQNKKEKIMIFANKIQQIKKEDIKKFLRIFKETCPPDIVKYDDVIESISSFISHRCNKIKEACNNNLFGGKCYV